MDIPGTGFLTTYIYDLANHRTQITQGAQTRTFVTDAAGRTTSVTEPESALTSYTYTYNATGLLVTRTRPKANQSNGSVLTTTTTQYDRLGRVINVNYDDSLTPFKWFFYDATPTASGWSIPGSNLKGRLAATTADEAASNQHAWTHYTYDVAGNVAAMWQCATLTCGTGAQESRPALQFSYDFAGSLMSEYDGTSGNIIYGRSVLGQITSVTNQTYTDPTNTPNLVSNVVNGPFGITNWHLGNSTSAVQSFTSSGRLNGGWLCSGNGGDGQSANCSGSTQLYGYALALSGSRVTCAWDTVTGQCQSHGYDDFNRLTSIANSNGNFSWAYDRYGNRLSQSGSPSVSSSYDVTTNRSTSFGYDAAGNQTNDALHNYTYDGEGKVLSVDNGSTVRYLYNALDQRVRGQTANSTYEYVFDPFGRRTSSWLLNGTATGAGKEGRIYWDYGLLANRSWNGGTYFHHTNWLGTERMRTNYQGNVANQQASYAFGDGLTQSSSDSTGAAQDNNQFTSQDQDAETGTIHFQYRQYSSTQGRWMSPDPYIGSYDYSNPQSLNRYAYVLDNPYTFLDPDGLDYIDKAGNNCFTQTTMLGDSLIQSSVACGSGSFFPGFTIWGGPSDPNWFDGSCSGCFANVGVARATTGSNAPSKPRTVSQCLGQAASDKGVSIGLDIVGAIPALGNAASAAGFVRAAISVDHAITSPVVAVGSGVYSGYGAISSRNEDPTDSLVGGASAGTGIGLALADASLQGTKAIPIVGNVVSGLTGLWDGYKAYQKYQSCMAGH